MIKRRFRDSQIAIVKNTRIVVVASVGMKIVVYSFLTVCLIICVCQRCATDEVKDPYMDQIFVG